MTTTTTNYGWTIPSDTDLVTNGASAMRTLGQGIDTSLVGLKGGTTGQILSKTSGTDMAFTWITNDVGDITAVTTTAPLQGGASSGAVALTVDAASTTAAGVVQLSNSTSTTSSTLAATPTAVKSAYDLAAAAIPKTLTTTTGDIIYASGANTPARLGIGSSAQVLTVSGGVPSWATPAGGGGKVLQVVQATYSTSTNSSSATYADTGLTATITPTLNTSKVLVLVNQAGCGKNSGNDGTGLSIKLFRGATLLAGQYDQCFDNNAGTYVRIGTISLEILDTPATTSATTYKTQFINNSGGSGTVTVQQASSVSSITLLEIGA